MGLGPKNIKGHGNLASGYGSLQALPMPPLIILLAGIASVAQIK
jgi:hypothetical protein